MELRDVYKLLYQGILGPEHMIHSSEVFIERLQDEWNGLDTENDDPVFETIRPDGKLHRVNLRPYKAMGGSLENLADACLETAKIRWGTKDELVSVWHQLTTANRELGWATVYLDEVEPFSLWLQLIKFPPVHHSESYRNSYRPAYRLAAPILVSSSLKEI
jgi:hypothetical protein